MTKFIVFQDPKLHILELLMEQGWKKWAGAETRWWQGGLLNAIQTKEGLNLWQ